MHGGFSPLFGLQRKTETGKRRKTWARGKKREAWSRVKQGGRR
jgi:hypothetical protein